VHYLVFVVCLFGLTNVWFDNIKLMSAELRHYYGT